MKSLRILLQSNLIYILLLLSSFFYSFIYISNQELKSVYDINQTSFKMKIKKIKIDGDKLTLELKDKETIIGTYYFKKRQEKENFNYNLGDIIEIKGELKIPLNNTIPNTFNYKEHLNNHKIYYNLSIKSIKLHKKNDNILYNIKNKIIKRIENFKLKEYYYIFIIGESHHTDSNMYDLYKYNGITHLFAVSGMHIGILSIILLKLLKAFKIPKKKRYLLTIIFLIYFMFLVSFSPSVVRATLFFILISINKLFNLKIKTINIFLLILSLLLYINPLYIYDLGFQLSFIVTFFILITINNTKDKKYLNKALYISLITFLASMPLIININHTINIFSIINNIIFIPYVSFLVYPVNLLSFIFTFLEPINNFLIDILNKLTIICSNIKILNIPAMQLNIYTIIIYYILLTLFTTNNKKIYLMLIILLFIINNSSFKQNKNTTIYFTDVGQGDSTLIITKNNSTILIDTGGKENFIKKEKWQIRNKEYRIGDNLLSFYRSIGIKKIDYMFLTHGDMDHLGEAKFIKDNIKVDNIYINKGEINKKEKELKPKILTKENMEIDNINIKSLNKKIYNNENEDSLILQIKIKKYKILFTGDSTIKQERDIKKERVDILKVGHHGSKTSTSEEFMKEIHPKYSVISVGRNNMYNHPRDEVLYNLRKTKIYRTDKMGTIKVTINNKLSIEKTLTN